MTSIMMKVRGHCHCGKISFEAEVDPATVGICHCTDCQTLTGTAFRATVRVLAADFALTGEPKIYVKHTADSGTLRAHAFCPDCGTPIYSTTASTPPTAYSLRIGTLDRRAELLPRRQVWCASALPWSMDLRGVEQLAKQ